MTYDASDRVRTITDGKGVVQTISYDDNDRVTAVAYSGTGSFGSVSYTYDSNGNRTQRRDMDSGAFVKTSTYTLDKRNRLVNEVLPNVTNSYTYDQAGNLASMTTPWGVATNPTQPAEANPYNYTGCNPVNQTDPTGAISWGCVADSMGSSGKWNMIWGARRCRSRCSGWCGHRYNSCSLCGRSSWWGRRWTGRIGQGFIEGLFEC